ncbi:hypothetical protein OOU_Y34scaffold00275g15 [Pyricularia oryzae Y34]|uniref:Uncharacterized protein n=3 Tax=Pyricularia oryzae TaxID=318829 RepID=Q2KF66_PYRO7|nr:hypothetical protein MGCH7_ch7g820 [Pyricularia oryzae 70-15]ELQ41499.1 hypothetical protein OOU_Y34scaffold00275g15 [Pyricularia oryzae Y34]
MECLMWLPIQAANIVQTATSKQKRHIRLDFLRNRF